MLRARLRILRRGDHLDRAVLVGDDVLGAGIERRIPSRLSDVPGANTKLSAMLEVEGDETVVPSCRRASTAR